MTAAVRYYTKTGHTEKLANKIAEVAGVSALKLDAPITEPVDVLFLGASIYAANIDKEVVEFINSIDCSKVGSVAVFSTSALVERSFPEIKQKLEARGIKVLEDNFYCRGQFTMFHKGKPDANDIENAGSFAKRILG